MYAVILAGGGGTRLWPLSRPDRPKPFLPLLGEESLLQRTARRVGPLISPEDVFVVTDRRYLPLVEAQLLEVPRSNLIGEPMGRNTAAAVALATEAIGRPGDEVMVILPADHQVLDEAGFRAALAAAGQLAADGSLVTLGVQPTGPETGYGYILARPPALTVAGRTAFAVERFVEKPDVAKARALLDTGLASWNAGIFVWQRGSIRERLRRYAGDIAGPVAGAVAGRTADVARSELEAAYPTVRATSIDYAVMEPASIDGCVRVVPIDVGWSDLGSWSALRDAWVAEAGAADTAEAASGTVGSGPRRDIGSTGTLVLADGRLVVTIGLRDTIVVDTPDALLVCAADRSQDVRQIAEELAAAARAREGEAAPGGRAQDSGEQAGQPNARRGGSA